MHSTTGAHPLSHSSPEATGTAAAFRRADWVALAGVLGVTLAARLLPAIYRGVEVSDLSIYRHMALIVLRQEDIYEVRNIFPYTPLSLYLPAFALQLAGWLHQPFHLVMKTFPLLGDLGTAAVIFLLGQRRGSRGRACLLGLAFALNPVSILITGMHGNIMPLSVFFAFWAYYLLDHPQRERTYVLSALALGMGIGLRSWPVLLVPLLLRPGQLKWRQRFVYLVVAGLPAVLTLAPYMLANFNGIRHEVFEYKSVADLGWVGAWRAYYFLQTGSRQAPRAAMWLSNSRFYFLEAYGVVVVAAWVVPALLDTAGWIATVLLLTYTVMGGMAAQYYCWVLPFLIGYPVYYGVFSLVATGALITFYLALHPGIVFGPFPPPFSYTQPQIFTWNLGFLIVTWAVGAGWLLWVIRQLVGRRRVAASPPLVVLQPARMPWVRWCTLALTGALAGALGLELPFIAHSRPPAEVPATIEWISAGHGAEPGRFDAPMAVGVDPSGNIYVSDLGNHRVDRFDSTGKFLDAWHTNEGAATPLVEPGGIAALPSGEVYVLDTAGRIVRLEPDGTVAPYIDLVRLGSYSPRGLAFDNVRQRFYVTDAGKSRILVLAADGKLIDTWGGANTKLSFDIGWGLAIDSHGNVFVTERGNSRVRKLSPAGALLAEWTVRDGIYDVAVGADDRVYVSSSDRAQLWVYDDDGHLLGQIRAPMAAHAQPQGRALATAQPHDLVLATEASLIRLNVKP
jgi:DNA-binding beta-propeller fold protein YncE